MVRALSQWHSKGGESVWGGCRKAFLLCRCGRWLADSRGQSMKPGPVSDDVEVASAFEWLQSCSRDVARLAQRIADAREYYRQNSPFVEGRWQDFDALMLPSDPLASYLAQVDGFLRDSRLYDLRLGPRIIPFMKRIGSALPDLRDMVGAETRARRLVDTPNEHPDGGLFELATAARYLCEGLDLEFVAETNHPTPDLRAVFDDVELHIECKRLRSSEYEERESRLAKRLFDEFQRLVHDRRLSVCVDVVFKKELHDVPQDYLVQRVEQVLRSRVLVRREYPWSDEFADGSLCNANLYAVRNDMEDSALLVGPKMARLLSGKVVAEGSYFLSVGGIPSGGDSRFLDEVNYGSVLTWGCSSPGSVSARARFIKSKLADIDRQTANASAAIAHIAMDAERDPHTSDQRFNNNHDAVIGFRWNSRAFETHLHYLLARTSEHDSWMIDETIDSFSAGHGSILGNPMILAGEDNPLADNRLPAWHQPPPPHDIDIKQG